MKTIKVKQKVNEILAVEVTEENMKQVAKWCDGGIHRDACDNPHVYITAADVAYIGDYVLKGYRGEFATWYGADFYENFEVV